MNVVICNALGEYTLGTLEKGKHDRKYIHEKQDPADKTLSRVDIVLLGRHIKQSKFNTLVFIGPNDVLQAVFVSGVVSSKLRIYVIDEYLVGTQIKHTDNGTCRILTHTDIMNIDKVRDYKPRRFGMTTAF